MVYEDSRPCVVATPGGVLGIKMRQRKSLTGTDNYVVLILLTTTREPLLCFLSPSNTRGIIQQ